jgi:hypothetical protein
VTDLVLHDHVLLHHRLHSYSEEEKRRVRHISSGEGERGRGRVP